MLLSGLELASPSHLNAPLGASVTSSHPRQSLTPRDQESSPET